MENKEPIPVKYFKFAEVIEGLQKGKVFTRWDDGSFISMQIPANIKAEDIKKMQSLNEKTKELLSVKKGVYYKNQVLRIFPLGEKAMATYYQPTWTDILASDWLDL